MALPTSGPLSLANIQTEFGGSNPISLSEYYAGGTYVPSGTTGTYGAVPSSGTIGIRNFYGTSGVAVNFTDASVSSVSYSVVSARYRIDNDGYVYVDEGSGYYAYENWVLPLSAGSNYEVYATLTSGTLTSGTTGSWVATSGDPAWVVTATTSPSTVAAALTFQVRAVGSATVLDTWTVNLSAERG